MALGRSLCALVAISMLSAPVLAAERSPVARQLYAEGKAQYAQGHYAEAAQLFERSYALSESSALLFNMAQAHRLAGPGHCRDALKLYESYLNAAPEAENRKEVEERIQQLGDCSSDTAAREAPAGAAPPSSSGAPVAAPAPLAPVQPSSPHPSRVRTGPVLVTGAGAALLVAGGVLYWRAWDKHREFERICPCYPGTVSKWELLTNISYALLAVGGATTATGLSWWAFGEPSRDGQPSQAMVGLSGRF